MRFEELTADQLEMLDIITRIPADRLPFVRDFLLTHVVEPDRFVDGRANFEYYRRRKTTSNF